MLSVIISILIGGFVANLKIEKRPYFTAILKACIVSFSLIILVIVLKYQEGILNLEVFYKLLLLGIPTLYVLINFYLVFGFIWSIKNHPYITASVRALSVGSSLTTILLIMKYLEGNLTVEIFVDLLSLGATLTGMLITLFILFHFIYRWYRLDF